MITADYQKLEPGSEVRVFEVDCTGFGGDVLRFHAHNVPPVETPQGFVPGKIYWQGYEYTAWPCSVEGVEISGHGSAPTPTLSVGNIDLSITALCLYFDNLNGAKVVVHETLAHYLDARNFPEGNPKADPEQEATSTWYIEQKTAETDEMISFSLSSPADFQGQVLPGRQIHGLCHWALTGGYRGADCGYMGSAMFDEKGAPTDDPSKDKCSGCLADCKKRFGENEELSFGGFPASSLIRS